jgi:hypothetical protein
VRTVTSDLDPEREALFWLSRPGARDAVAEAQRDLAERGNSCWTSDATR